MQLRPLTPRSPLATALVAGTSLFALVLLARTLGLLQPGELAIYDLQLQRASRAAREAPPIALVLIRERDIQALGHPLTDTLLGRLLERLLAADPRAVGVDLYRDQPVPTEAGDPRLDTRAYLDLGGLVTADDRIIMTMKFPDPGQFGTPRPRFLRDDIQVGFADLPVDPGGTIRRGLLFMWDRDRPLISLPLQLVLRYLRAENVGLGPSPDDPEVIQLGETVVPPLRQGFGPYVRVDDGGYQFLLDYGWGLRGIPSYDLSDVLDGKVAPEAFRDRIVLVGTGAPSVKDSFFTPHSRGAGGQPMYGVEVHAQAADQLIRYALGRSRPLTAPGAWLVAGWIFAWALVGAGIGSIRGSLFLTLAFGVLASAGLVTASTTSFANGTWLPLLAPLLAGVGATGAASAMGSASERAQRRQLASLFSRFQGSAVAEDIWSRRHEFVGEEGRPVSRRITVTTLMADLEGYTAASEKLEPTELMAWVNKFLSAAAAVVEEHGGVVDDYAGDGIKANFGFPAPGRTGAEIDAAAAAAVRAAIGVGRRMEALNEEWSRRDLPPARVRMGVFTGPAVAGFIGGDRALKYTSVGASVNIASRLEGFGKDGFRGDREASWRVLIGEETHRRTEGLFEVVPLGAHPLKGVDAPVQIYRVVGESGAPSSMPT